MDSCSQIHPQFETFRLAVTILCQMGHRVQPAIDAPGLYRIDGGEERTAEEFIKAALCAVRERLTVIDH